MRTVYFADGLLCQGSGGRGDIECEIRTGDICIVEPYNPRNKANGHRGRVCKFTGKARERGHSLSAHVQFQDEKGDMVLSILLTLSLIQNLNLNLFWNKTNYDLTTIPPK